MTGSEKSSMTIVIASPIIDLLNSKAFASLHLFRASLISSGTLRRWLASSYKSHINIAGVLSCLTKMRVVSGTE